MSCCCCTPCCQLHNISTCHVLLLLYTMLSTTQYQHVPCLVAVVHHVVNYTNISTCHVLLLLYTMLSTTQISAPAMSCCCCTPCYQLHKYQHMPCRVAIVHHVVNYTNISTCMSCCYCTPCCQLHKYQHLPCLVAVVHCTKVGSATASFGLANSFPGAKTSNSRTERGTLILLINTTARAYNSMCSHYSILIIKKHMSLIASSTNSATIIPYLRCNALEHL